MRKQLLFIFLSTLLLSTLLLTGCGSDQNTVSENAIPEESTAGHIAPISDLLVIEACEELSSDPSDYLLIADGTDISKIQLHFEEVNSIRNGEYPVNVSYGEESVEFTIQIEDTIPPVITLKENIPTFSPYERIDDCALAEIDDISGVLHSTLEPKEGSVCRFEEPGEYEVEIQATDMNGNKNTMTLTVTVRELEPILDPEMVEQIQKDDALSPALKDYLLGNAAAVIGKDVDFENIYREPFSTSPIPSGQSATIQDICDMIKAGDNRYSHPQAYYLLNIKYGILDCGMDGTPDLAVQYYFTTPSLGTHMTTIIHEENGKLTLNCAEESGYRSGSILYRDGYFISYGASGADVHGLDCSILNKSGRLQEIYSYIVYTRGTELQYIDPDDLAKQDYFGYEEGGKPSYTEEEDFKEMLIKLGIYEYTIGDKTYLYTYPESDPDDTDHKSLPYYLSLCEKHGASICTGEEIDKLITDHMASLGFSDWKAPGEYTEEDEVEWQLLLGNE